MKTKEFRHVGTRLGRLGLGLGLGLGVSLARLPSRGAAWAEPFEVGISCDVSGLPRGSARLVRVVDETTEGGPREGGPREGGPREGGPQDFVDDALQDMRAFTVSWNARSDASVSPVDRPLVGGDVRILRCLPLGRWDVVGEGRALRANGLTVEARIVIPVASAPDDAHGRGALALSLKGNAFPRPMAGDVVVPVRHEVKSVARINPKRTLDAARLFDGDALTPYGRDVLHDELSRFTRASGRLLVEAHVMGGGDRDALRRLSQLRADAVAQFLARGLGVGGDRIVALGFGSDALSAGMREVARWPERDLDEFIVLRVLPE